MNTKNAGIYSITSKINGKRYIGSAINIKNRWIQHKSDLRLNKHHSPQLQNHFNKYGEEDLVFSILEIIDRNNLSLKEFKELIIAKEQVYLDNWDCCQFNCCKVAGSALGLKINNSKYYYKKGNVFSVKYNVFGKNVTFDIHLLEEDAIKEVEYIKTLSDQELLQYKNDIIQLRKNNPIKYPKKSGKGKNYYFHKKMKKWVVYFEINKTVKYFGNYYTEEEAIQRVKELKMTLEL